MGKVAFQIIKHTTDYALSDTGIIYCTLGKNLLHVLIVTIPIQ